jgi:hypothetical protein
MKVICNNYLCIIDRIDGGLREYHKNKLYNIYSLNDIHIVDGYPLSDKLISSHFTTIYEHRNKIINSIINE